MKALKKIGFVILFVLLLISFNDTDKVFVNNGKSATKYYLNHNCKRLTNNKSDIVKVLIFNAKSTGRTLSCLED